jgi:hypothetical protein
MIPAKEIDGELWIRAADHHKAIKEALAQPEQKPLPDFYIIEFELEALQRDGRRAVVLYTKPITNGIDVPVYTTPPQRKTLTEQQEREAFEHHWYDYYHAGSISPRSDGSYMHPAVQKAWEAWQARAAHGIKENT